MSVLDKKTLGAMLGETVTDMEISSGSKKGDNVAGALTSIKLKTESGNDHQIMIKMHPNEPSMLAYLIRCRVMEVELEFYRSILPVLRKLLDSHNQQHVDLPFPAYLGGSDIFIALEDLRPRNFRMANKYDSLTLPETTLVLQKLGFFHALTHSLIRQEGEKIFETNEITRQFPNFPWYPPQLLVESRKLSVPLFTVVVDILREINPELGDKLATLVPKFFELFPGIFNKTDVKYFPVICHSDLWTNNILFRYGEDGSVKEVKFLDLQQCHRGNIYEDLMYFFMTSTTPAFRKAHLTTVLQAYYKSFEKTMRGLNCPMPRGFTLGFLIDNYFENLANIAVFVGGAIGFQLGGSLPEVSGQEEEKEEVKKDQVKLVRYTEKDVMTLEEHFAGVGPFVKMNLETSERAKKRFVDVMQEFDELGVFS